MIKYKDDNQNTLILENHKYTLIRLLDTSETTYLIKRTMMFQDLCAGKRNRRKLRKTASTSHQNNMKKVSI